MLKMERRQDYLMVYLSGELNFFNSSKIKEEIKRHITGDEARLVLDISELEMIDSSGVGIVISLLKKMNGKDVMLVGPQPKIARVFEITRLNQIVPIFPSLEQADKP